MLSKLLKVAHFSRGNNSKLVNPDTLQEHKMSHSALSIVPAGDDAKVESYYTARRQEPKGSHSALRIVHAGGKVEFYYMAIPAVRILEKYPSYVLAKPEVFWRPWNSVVVRPEKILVPGQKFLLVPVGTVKKLRRRIKKPSKDSSFVSQSSNDDVLSEASVSSFISSIRKRSGTKKHVTFAGIDVKAHKALSSTNTEMKGKVKDCRKKGSHSQSNRGKWRHRNAGEWQPSLISISEITLGN